jgi:hypothetical protein
MDPVKIIIFVAAFLLLLLLGRKLSGSGDAHVIPPPYQDDAPPVQAIARPVSAEDEDSAPAPDSSRLVGTDLPFPIKLPEIERNQDGRYNRPEFQNYYFEKIDLKTGPVDPTSFCDDFYVVARDIESNHPGSYKYLVATPAGLQAVMASEHLPALYIDDQTVIVPRWDLPLILETVVKQIMKTYTEPRDEEANALPNEDA